MATRTKLDTLTFEQLQSGDQMVRQFRAMVLEAEAEREQVEPWIDAVIGEIPDGLRLVFIARMQNALAGYMILKPREQKISTIWVGKRFRGWGVGQKFYGIGFVNLGIGNPYTAFMHDMIEEMRPLAQSYALVLDDIGPMCVLNPDDREPWAKAEATTTPPPGAAAKVQIQQQATRLVRQKISAYQS